MPWIKSIYSDLDITFYLLASKSSGHVMVLWRHQQYIVTSPAVRKQSEETPNRLFVIMRGLCRVKNRIMFVLEWRTIMHSLGCYFGIYSLCCFATQEINTKMTLSRGHKQVVTLVHTLSHMDPWIRKNIYIILEHAYHLHLRILLKQVCLVIKCSLQGVHHGGHFILILTP